MSLMRLLTVGQSLVKGSNQPSPYKLDEQKLLPKFATVGRPVSLAPPPKPVAVPRDLFQSVRAEAAAEAPAAMAEQTVIARATAKLAPVVANPVSGLAQNPAAAVAPKRKLFSFRAKARAGRLVQSELSLDGVKVVRNDLSESDFEIVAPKPAVPAPPLELAVKPVVAAPTESLWKRWTNRVVGVVRTII